MQLSSGRIFSFFFQIIFCSIRINNSDYYSETRETLEVFGNTVWMVDI